MSVYTYSVVCNYTGEILFESPFLYECDKFIHHNHIAGAADVYDVRSTIPRVAEYFSGYFDLQMIAIQLQCISK